MVSVIIPTYNREKTIRRSIESILNKTYQDFEIIVVDYGSVDNTYEVVKSIDDNRIVYVKHEVNKGPSIARNTGIFTAKGDIIAFQDSDDEWFSYKLELQLNTMKEFNCDIVVGEVFFVDEDGNKRKFPNLPI